MEAISGWDNFYVIVGSAAGALIGLQFVVLTLISNRPVARAADAGAAFATPTIVNFGAVLFLSAAVSAPWQGMGTISVIWGLVGLCGIAYTIVVARRMRVQTAHKPVFEDWVFHAALPSAAHAMLIGSALRTRFQVLPSLFMVAAATLLLLFIGIHNAWDAVTYHVFVNQREPRDAERNR